jgi:uncharacterized damage-inducible protein DinB
MLPMLQDLVQHKWYANAAMIKAIGQHEAAAQDLELRKTLHHILLANRYWLSLLLTLPFVLEEESRIPESLAIVAAQYQETQAREVTWLAEAQEADLAGLLETPFMPGVTYSVAQALMQVCLHSHGHRAQCTTRLRSLGGTPPATDFILWLKERPAPDWD